MIQVMYVLTIQNLYASQWRFYFIIIIISIWKLCHLTCWHVNGSSDEFQEYVLVVFILAINILCALSLLHKLCFKLVPIFHWSALYHIPYIFWYWNLHQEVYDLYILSVTSDKQIYNTACHTLQCINLINLYNVVFRYTGAICLPHTTLYMYIITVHFQRREYNKKMT